MVYAVAVWIGLKWLRIGTRYYFSVSSVEHSEPITRDLGYYEEYLKVKGYVCLCVDQYKPSLV
jgi:hypothetical protein